jgi:hypothetical protein
MVTQPLLPAQGFVATRPSSPSTERSIRFDIMSADPGYEELWRRIALSPFGGTYVQELHMLATNVMEEADRVFEDVPRPKPGDADQLRVDHSITDRLVSLLGDAARVSAMLTQRERRGGAECP